MTMIVRAFDYSLVVGQFVSPEWLGEHSLLITADEAIERVSKVMTIRQGDMIYIDCQADARRLVPEEEISVQKENNELLYCKIK